jgi:hypothetical protein
MAFPFCAIGTGIRFTILAPGSGAAAQRRGTSFTAENCARRQIQSSCAIANCIEGASFLRKEALGGFEFPYSNSESAIAPTALPTLARQPRDDSRAEIAAYLGGAGGGVKISRLRPGSGFGFGLGAFFVSLLPLSLFPMRATMTQKAFPEKPQARAQSRRFSRPHRTGRPRA